MRALNLLVFREDRRSLRGLELKQALTRELEKLQGSSPLDDDELIGALLRAGELECAVADEGSAPVEPYMNICDRLAEALVARQRAGGGRQLDCDALIRVLGDSRVPEHVEVSPAEGFAYYALHPLAFAEALSKMRPLPATVAVIGIRTIGTTLSAVAAAALRARGTKAGRITVRPVGHPYDRRTRFAPQQLDSLRQHLACGAAFVVVDEGPGLSGSSFLSVAEALVEAGAPCERIILLCGREPEVDSLCAASAPQRARKFRWIAASSEPPRPSGAEVCTGGGEWRRYLFREESEWPGSWISFERIKYLSSADAVPRRLFKFAGLGHYGEQVLARERKVAVAGFGPVPQRAGNGFASYPWIDGRPMSAPDFSGEVVARLAAYCAFRAETFAADVAHLTALEQMAEHNLHELGGECPVKLRLVRPVIADGRMQPHEWLLTQEGKILKTDSGSHGDDHFFPGHADIAWDLAGAIVEWRMNPAQAEAFLEAYRRISGDDARERIADFVNAYSVFRCAWCRMAIETLQENEEQARLKQAMVRYRALFKPESALAA